MTIRLRHLQGPNGLGSSLERANETDPRVLKWPTAWHASSVPGGTPGYPNSIQVWPGPWTEWMCVALDSCHGDSQSEPGHALLKAVEFWPQCPTSRDNVTITARFKMYGAPVTTVVMKYEWAEHALDVERVAMQYEHAIEVCRPWLHCLIIRDACVTGPGPVLN